MLLTLALLPACTTTNLTLEQNYTVAPVDTGNPDVDLPDVPDDGLEDVPGAPPLTAQPDEMTIAPFGNDGNLYWFGVSLDQLSAMNSAWSSYAGSDYYYYDVGNPDTYADNLVVTDAASGETANYGKVQLAVVGESTGMTWTDTSIPDLSVDADEFQEGLRIGDVEHLRFNNGMISSIFRELIALEIFDALGYPAPRTAFAWAGSNVWGDDERVPYTLVEAYHKDAFCVDHADQLGGGCANIWEGSGTISTIGTQCQEKECDNTRLDALVHTLSDNPHDVYNATKDTIDWSMVQQHLCIDWILWIGDDPYRNNNNVVLTEGLDGKFRLLPYSTDISAGQAWYQNTTLYGIDTLSNGCARDATCWADTLATCSTLIDAFQALHPTDLVDDAYTRLNEQGMIRDGDDDTYLELMDWYTTRSTEGVLETELLDYPDKAMP